ncbi:MAG: ATP-binding protein [Sumerlaeia bacterium]
MTNLMPNSQADLCLSLRADPKLVVIACKAVRNLAEIHGMNERDCYRLELATDEVCSNAITHACERDEHRNYRLEAAYDEVDDSIVVWVYDRGEGFDIERVKEVKELPKPPNCPVGGLGLHLVRKVTDDIDYLCGKNGENCLIFRKRVIPEPKLAAEA